MSNHVNRPKIPALNPDEQRGKMSRCKYTLKCKGVLRRSIITYSMNREDALLNLIEFAEACKWWDISRSKIIPYQIYVKEGWGEEELLLDSSIHWGFIRFLMGKIIYVYE